jgi:hypothetical protein
MYRQIKRAASLGAVMLVAGVPSAAMARPIDQDRAPTFEVATPAAQSASPPAVHAAQNFHWDDAGLGAAGMLAVVAAGSGAAVAVRRRAVLS